MPNIPLKTVIENLQDADAKDTAQLATVGPAPVPSGPSYFVQRMAELGATNANATCTISYEHLDDSTPRKVSIFTEEKYGGIDIHYVGLNGLKTYLKDGKKEVAYRRTRQHPARCQAGKPRYLTPKGAGVEVFFPPMILVAHDQQQRIDTLVVTEGEFKAFKASLHELHCVGAQGIHNVHEKDVQGNKIINSEIQALINTCQVKNVVLLLDNDCLTVEFDPDKDLLKRPNSFYTAVRTFRECCKSLPCDVYFAHLRTDLPHKGLDDLLIAMPGRETEVLEQLTALRPEGDFFCIQNITDRSLNTLKSYFNIANVESFYEAYEGIIKEKRFRYGGHYYEYDGKNVNLLVSDEINRFLRVGDEYFEKIQKPDRTGKLFPSLEKRKKTTITDDYGSKAIQYIKKFKAFCLVPNHTDYSESVEGCFNSYHPLDYQPQTGDCPHSLEMVRHIFKEHYEFGLDYLQLLYTDPGQLLPILLLQSKERNTGKSTFGQWQRDIFGNNVAKLGNADLESDFNSTYAEKLLVVVDETTLSKKITSEAIKRMSTEKGKIFVNAKNRQQYETDWIGKFIFITNTVDVALYIGKGENRYFVRTIPALPSGHDVEDMDDKLRDEIPAFLHFLQHRTLVHQRGGRMFFRFQDYRTPELDMAINANVTAMEREIRHFLADSFAHFPNQAELKFAVKDIFEQIKDGYRYAEERSIRQTLKNDFSLEPGDPASYEYFSLRESRNDGGDQCDLSKSYRRFGRVYTFKKDDFAPDSSSAPTRNSANNDHCPF